MLSVVANATEDDERPVRLELYLFFSLLFSAGAETTRNSVAGGLLAMIEQPVSDVSLRTDLELLHRGRRDGAVDVAVTVEAADRDPGRRTRRLCHRGGTEGAGVGGLGQPRCTVFADADDLDIARKPNPHLGFGQGIHYCLGANLARLELRVLFEELLDAVLVGPAGPAGRVDP